MDELIDNVQNHLKEVQDDPTTPLDAALLGKLDRGIVENLPSTSKRALVHRLAALLPTLQQDPAPAAALAKSLLSADDAGTPSITYSEILALEPPVDFERGLDPTATPPPLNLVTLALLGKAAASAADAGRVASKAAVVAALVRLWLRAARTDVAAAAQRVLEALLAAEAPGAAADAGGRSPAEGVPAQGLMWRRVFRDKDVYGLLFSLCSLRTVGAEGQLSKREKTVAQGRLLDWIRKVCYAPQVWSSQVPEVEKEYGVKEGGGLLDFATVNMVDFKDDVLIHTTLLEFFTEFISRSNGDMLNLNSTKSANVSEYSSESLDFMISRGLHKRTMLYFLKPDQQDPLDAAFLYGSSTRYVAAYANHYPTHFQEHAAEHVLARLSAVISGISMNVWASNRIPTHDISLLANLPQRSLLLVDGGELATHLPVNPANPDSLNALASIFRGPRTVANAEDLEVIVPPPATAAAAAHSASPAEHLTKMDQAAARVLFYLYFSKNPDTWKQLVATGSRVAIKDAALAAVGLIEAVINASWVPLRTSNASENDEALTKLPTEAQLGNRASQPYPQPLPRTGVLAVLRSPAIEQVLPFLMEPGGDKSEAGFEVAAAKHSVLSGLREKVQKIVDGEEDGGEEQDKDKWEQILDVLTRREKAGVLGRTGGGGPGGGTGRTAELATMGR